MAEAALRPQAAQSEERPEKLAELFEEVAREVPRGRVSYLVSVCVFLVDFFFAFFLGGCFLFLFGEGFLVLRTFGDDFCFFGGGGGGLVSWLRWFLGPFFVG